MFINPSHGWLARGTNGRGELLVTDDGGTSWKTQYTSELAPQFIQFVDANNGYLAGCAVPVGLSSDCQTQLLASHDGGSTWTPVASPPMTQGKVVAIEFVSPQDGWVLGALCQASCADARAQLFRTSDGGVTWSQVALPDGRHPRSVQRVDSHHAWVVTEDDILVTQDGGGNWTRVTNPCGGFRVGPLDFVDGLHGWLGCTGPGAASTAPKTLYQTLDAGHTWELIAATQDASRKYPLGVGELSIGGSLTDIHFFDAKTGWLALDGPQSFLYHTDDGGHTWNAVDDGVGGGIAHLFFTDPVHGWAWGGVLLSTTDGGAHWQKIELPP
jgi:photosystem II stability/assembly factor-like uncharacterized protein